MRTPFAAPVVAGLSVAVLLMLAGIVTDDTDTDTGSGAGTGAGQLEPQVTRVAVGG
ncbi:hypothetical protein ACGFXC_29860 [Streptomyces sp. NPDC048507]|uniref:hypothetical protein n=1 Tax=Streptomyces sp. NPDC048507 TaxID=3365560 RepID=UPI003723F2A7